MKGYVYSMFGGADPNVGWTMTDPLFGEVPTLGACMPNIRRQVVEGDYIFVISGRVPGVRQYLVGGFQVDEKISAMAAYRRFPSNRQKLHSNGSVTGNIIVTATGEQSPHDYHSNFDRRVENYIVGRDPVYLERDNEVELARRETLDLLQQMFRRTGDQVSEVLGRWRRLDEQHIHRLLDWFGAIQHEARGSV